jgi:hypothetical protein
MPPVVVAISARDLLSKQLASYVNYTPNSFVNKCRCIIFRKFSNPHPPKMQQYLVRDCYAVPRLGGCHILTTPPSERFSKLLKPGVFQALLAQFAIRITL